MSKNPKAGTVDKVAALQQLRLEMRDLSPGMFCIIPSQLLVYSGTFYGPSSTSNASKKFFFFGGFYANLCQKTNGIFLEGTMV